MSELVAAVRIGNRRLGCRSHGRTRQPHDDSEKVIGGPLPRDYRDPASKRSLGNVCTLRLPSESRMGEQQQRDRNRAASEERYSSSHFHCGCGPSSKTKTNFPPSALFSAARRAELRRILMKHLAPDIRPEFL